MSHLIPLKLLVLIYFKCSGRKAGIFAALAIVDDRRFIWSRYGSESVHSIEWNVSSKQEIMDIVIEIQRTMVEGGAKRDHERPGKCTHCSRREECPDRIDVIQAE